MLSQQTGRNKIQYKFPVVLNCASELKPKSKKSQIQLTVESSRAIGLTESAGCVEDTINIAGKINCQIAYNWSFMNFY